jgi:hypothetical protein
MQLAECGSDLAGVLLTLVNPRAHGRDVFSDSVYFSRTIKKYYTG